MIDHRLMDTTLHTFVRVADLSANDLFTRECRRLALLRRKFLEDAGLAKRIYVYRSIERRSLEEITGLFLALRRHGPNRLLFVHPPTDTLKAGEARCLQPGLAEAAIDELAPYVESTTIRSAMWPEVLRRGMAILGQLQ